MPGLAGQRGLGIAIALGSMWLVTAINIRGVKEAGLFQSITTYTKLVPFAAISVFGLFWVDWSTFSVINPSGQPFLSALAATAPLTMFAFLGIESATVPAGDVKDPTRTIPLATILGTLGAATIYILGTVAVMGIIPLETLAESSAPFADAASAIWGEWAGWVIAVAAIISSLGALNGWTLLLGQVPMAAARDGAMPRVFAQLSSRGVPARGLVISVGLATVLILIEISGSDAMVAFYNVIVQLATDAAMIPYVFCCVVEAILYVKREPIGRTLRIGPYTPVAIVALIFSLATIYGSGPQAGMMALILLMLAAPIWVFLVNRPTASVEGTSQADPD
jgi:amino acid transporter